MRKPSTFVFVLVAVFLALPPSITEASIKALVGVDFTDSITSPTDNTTAKLGFDLGGSYEIDLGPVAIDPGFILSFHGMDAVDATGGTTALSFKSLLIPIIARYYFIPMFNLGAGLQYNMGLGDVGASGSTNGSYTYAQLGNKSSSLNYVLSAEASIPLVDFNLLVELRFARSFGSVAVTGDATLQAIYLLTGMAF